MRISRKEFLRRYEAIKSMLQDNEYYKIRETDSNTLGMHADILYIVTHKITGEYDYIIRYDKDKKIFYGKPIELMKEFFEQIDSIVQDPMNEACYREGFLATSLQNITIYREIAKPDLSKFSWYIEGIMKGTVPRYLKEIVIPKHIKYFEQDSLKGVSCKKLVIPANILERLPISGFDFDPTKTNIELSNRKGWTIPYERVHKGDTYIRAWRYNHILDEDIDIIVYPTKIIIVKSDKSDTNNTSRRREEEEPEGVNLVTGFKFSKLYKSHEYLIMSMLLAYYGIVTISDVEASLIDIYKEKRKLLRS